ncbi:MAG: hypothetical protein PHQ11_03930 [Paludibacter sp.]|nr:hypothetical protein [Paludibacter sp.]MDD4198002.1 hypothetical protein [Paludibacter sp.]MDD4427635.1 hypothetical protein [Paludibacter sp.]
MQKYIYLISIIYFGLLVGCNPDLDYSIKGYTQKIIVEGVIESGKYPVVYLSLNVPLSKSVDTTTILDYVIRYAKVTVSNGDKTEILTSKWDKSYFPPYVYKGTEIIGEEGRTYDLKVEYGGYTLYSSTTIPAGFQVESVGMNQTAVDSLRTLTVKINLNDNVKNSYRIQTWKRKDTRFIKTPVLFNDGLNLSGIQTFQISPYPAKTDSSFTEGKYFVVGDTVDIKISAIDSVSTLFFKDLNMFSLVSGNIAVTEVKPLHSNISEPGFGIWYGAAIRMERVIIK